MIARLVALHTSGLTFQEAAVQLNRQFGCNFTRNALIGKLSRLVAAGLILPKPPPKPPNTARSKRQRSHIIVSPKGRPDSRLAAPPTPPPTDKPPATLETLAFPIQGRCKWAYGDGGKIGWQFCGLPTRSYAQPYCEAHTLRAWKPAPPLPLAPNPAVKPHTGIGFD